MKKISPRPEIQILADAEALAEYAAGQFVQISRDSINTQGRCSIALAGGSTPRLLYTLLTQPARKAQIDWSRVQVFWGDERCVPSDDPESNYLMARQALIDHVPLPAKNVHQISGDLEPGQAARRYERELQQAFPAVKCPRFDLVLLGLGDDGHTASLFPGSPALLETQRWVVPVEHHLPPPPLVTRVSLTFPVINAAANVFFLVSGMGKAKILSKVLLNRDKAHLLPAQHVYPNDGRLVWAVDKMAAGDYMEYVNRVA
jgi:6-phosphogluconolactonase